MKEHEVVSLSDYAESKRIVASRRHANAWVGPRFLELECFDWFQIPVVCGGDDSLYVKLYDDMALVWGYGNEPDESILDFNGSTVSVSPDFPVLLREDTKL